MAKCVRRIIRIYVTQVCLWCEKGWYYSITHARNKGSDFFNGKYIESRFDAKLNPVSWLWWGKSSIHFLIEMPIAFSFKNNQKLHKIEKRRRLAKNEINKVSGLGLVFYIHIKCTFIIKNNKSWKSWSNHHLFYSFANMRLITMI